MCLKALLYLCYLFELSLGMAILMYVFYFDALLGQRSLDLMQFEMYLCGIGFAVLGSGNFYAFYYRDVVRHKKRKVTFSDSQDRVTMPRASSFDRLLKAPSMNVDAVTSKKRL